jgi:hypothetical protein
MNVTAAKAAIKSLLDLNSSTLVTSLTQQGQARVIKHLTTTVLTPAKQYFFVAIHHEETAERSKNAGVANASMPPRAAEYNIVIHVEDYAISVAGEDELFETAQANFDKFVDRVVKLIKEQAWIGTSPRYRLPRDAAPEADRRVLRSDSLQAWYDDAEQYHAMLTSQIRFTLIDECVDDTALYT